MRACFIISILTLGACGDAGTPAPGGGDGTTDTAASTPSTTPSVDDVERTTHMGQMMLVDRIVDGVAGRELYGLYVDFHDEYLNLARCAVEDRACFNVLPAELDTWVDLDPDLEVDTNRTFYYVGLETQLGPYGADYTLMEGSGLSYYYRDLSDVKPAYGPAGASYGVEWGDYQGEDDIVLQEPLAVVSPDPYEPLKFRDGERIVFEWTPTGAGAMYLRVTAFNYERIYWLRDDGYFVFDVDELGFGADDEFVRVSLGRWNRTQIQNDGHRLDLVDLSEVEWNGGYFAQNNRADLEPADTCLEATGQTPITESETYWGRLGGFSGNLDPYAEGNLCTVWPAPGFEGMIPVELEPLEILTATYTLRNGDASMYLLEDCTDAGTCVAGIDETLTAQPERLQYFNETEYTQNLFLVLDGYSNASGGEMLGSFQLDLNFQLLEEPTMSDTCAGAQVQDPPLPAGLYFTDYLPYTNVLNPGAGGCTGSSLSGPESLTKISIPAGQTLSVVVNMPAGDPGIYLLYNCTNAFSCPVGADLRADGTETLAYTNASSVPETVYLVVDSKFGLSPYFLTIDLQ